MTFDIRYQEASLLTGRPWVADALTKAMRQGLVSLMRNDGTKVPISTRSALRDRRLLSDNQTLTDLGTAVALLSVPLREQCERIGIAFEEVELGGDVKPEKRALTWARLDGWQGAACEGGTLFTLMKAAALPALIRRAHRDPLIGHLANSTACSAYLEAQLQGGDPHEVAEEIRHATSAGVRKAFASIYRGYIVEQFPGLTADLMAALFQALGGELLAKLVLAIGSDPYRYRKGWPDLTLVRGGVVRFVEVKTSDRLHASQLITIPFIARTLGKERFSVVQLQRTLTTKGR